MLRLPVLATVAGLLLLAILPARAFAWDPEADRAVAQLAYERLTPQARSRVDGLLNSRPAVSGCQVRALDDSAEFATCLHGQKADFMRDVAYDSLPLCGPPPPGRCADGRCASAVLGHAIAELKDPATPRLEQVRALMATAYLIAEIHQPLHAADNGDRNGERVRVILPGALKAKANLYTVWDNDLVASAIGGTAETGLPYMRPLADAQGDAWSRGDVPDWLVESHDVALHVAYGRLPEPPACNKTPDRPEQLGPAYFSVATSAVREQLAKAAVRLAAVLNAAFSQSPSPT